MPYLIRRLRLACCSMSSVSCLRARNSHSTKGLLSFLRHANSTSSTACRLKLSKPKISRMSLYESSASYKSLSFGLLRLASHSTSSTSNCRMSSSSTVLPPASARSNRPSTSLAATAHCNQSDSISIQKHKRLKKTSDFTLKAASENSGWSRAYGSD